MRREEWRDNGETLREGLQRQLGYWLVLGLITLLGMNAAIKVEATRTRLFLVVVVIGGTARKSAYRPLPSA